MSSFISRALDTSILADVILAIIVSPL